MGLFGCNACAAKDETIKVLLARVDYLERALDKAQARLTEIAAPGAAYRIDRAAMPRPHKEATDAKAAREAMRFNAGEFPGYEPSRAPFKVEIE